MEDCMAKNPGTLFFDAGDTLIYLDPPVHARYASIINHIKKTRFDGEQVTSAIEELHRQVPMKTNGHFRYSNGWFDAGHR